MGDAAQAHAAFGGAMYDAHESGMGGAPATQLDLRVVKMESDDGIVPPPPAGPGTTTPAAAKKRKKRKPRTGTRPCLCKRCERRPNQTFGGINCKGSQSTRTPGGVALKAVPANTTARRWLVNDLGGAMFFGEEKYQMLCATTDPKYRISRAHFFKDQFQRAKTGENLMLRPDARAEVPLHWIWEKPWLRPGAEPWPAERLVQTPSANSPTGHPKTWSAQLHSLLPTKTIKREKGAGAPAPFLGHANDTKRPGRAGGGSAKKRKSLQQAAGGVVDSPPSQRVKGAAKPSTSSATRPRSRRAAAAGSGSGSGRDGGSAPADVVEWARDMLADEDATGVFWSAIGSLAPLSAQGRAEIKKMITAGASGGGGSNGSSSGSSEGDVAADRDAFAARLAAGVPGKTCASPAGETTATATMVMDFSAAGLNRENMPTGSGRVTPGGRGSHTAKGGPRQAYPAPHQADTRAV